MPNLRARSVVCEFSKLGEKLFAKVGEVLQGRGLKVGTFRPRSIF